MLEIDYTPSKSSQELLDFISSHDMKWYLQPKDGPIIIPFFYHSLMTRERTDYPKVGRINSSLYDPCKKMFLEVCDQANVSVEEIYRACLNATVYYPAEHTGIHVDHNFPHKNFIMYLTDAGGATYIFDQNKNITETSNPQKNRAIIFGGELHAQASCKLGETRIVLVVTFK